MKIFTYCNLILFLTLIVSGCGMSSDYQRNKLSTSSDFELCYASTDLRGLGYAVKRQAANEIIKERKIACDYKLMAQIHMNEHSKPSTLLSTSNSNIEVKQSSTKTPEQIRQEEKERLCTIQAGAAMASTPGSFAYGVSAYGSTYSRCMLEN